ncbi:stalk domain-containing protein [Cohnella cellulosilytica]|uniref:Stalk domain-containing protein n=1 Tax=Cohnella cellulosilytica TaxID=986710 RepID=A0ABW2FEP5_9BACL
MKRLAIALSSAVLAFAMAGTASAATAAKPSAVQVQINGEAVDIGGVLIEKGKSYIEYGALFKALGYGTELDASTQILYAESEDYEIQASADADIAIVNGRTIPSTGEIIEREGRTLIGVRFAGTLTNHKVLWNGKDKTISLVFQGPTAEDKTSVNAFFSKMLLVEAAGDAEGIVRLMADDTVMDLDEVRANFERTATKTNVTEINIQAFGPGEAVVLAVEDTKKVSGKFYPDNLAQVRYTLHKDSAGEWKIYNVEVLGLEYTNIPGLFEQQATLPEADKAAIGKTFEEQVKAANEQDVEAYVGTLADFPEKEQLKDQLTQMFETTTLNVTSEQWTVVDYDGDKGTASLLVKMLSETETGGQVFKSRSVVLNDAVKVDGKWLLQAEAIILSSEPLQ